MTSTQIPRSPKLPVIVATSMLYAQGYKPTATERAAMKAYADWKRGVLEVTGPQEVCITVVDAHVPTAELGWLTFTA